MGSGWSTSDSGMVIRFRYGKPQFKGTSIHSMFNGCLYRISDSQANRWAFYNDTPDLIIHIAILFDYDSSVAPLGETVAFRIDDPREGCEDDYGRYLCQLDVPPRATKLFVQGMVTGWRVDTLEARSVEAADIRQYRL